MPGLSQSSGDLIADRRYAIAQDFLARGDLPAAADLLAQAIEAAPRTGRSSPRSVRAA